MKQKCIELKGWQDESIIWEVYLNTASGASKKNNEIREGVKKNKQLDN